jgi:predicted nuclease of predicted toxin-antitoxin system
MKLLLDESLPKDLSRHLRGHEVVTVPERGWGGKQNSELLQLASEEFDAFLTADQNLEHQQDLSNLPISVVVLVAPSNRLADLVPLVPKLLLVLAELEPRKLVRVAAA